ncbi:MAG: twin-arginine translocation signal domain-containing protein, partial [Planctomycetales bacterium]|nr:twin-arginine translocation signal domain-containing protein [Planctomycetales bacterium]
MNLTRRRDFLKLCGYAGLGLASGAFWEPSPGCADDRRELPPYEGSYYVVFNAAGGWDTTYLMDPKGVGGINRLFQEGDILSEGSHR